MGTTLPPCWARAPVAKRTPRAASSLQTAKLEFPWGQGCSCKDYLCSRGSTVRFH